LWLVELVCAMDSYSSILPETFSGNVHLPDTSLTAAVSSQKYALYAAVLAIILVAWFLQPGVSCAKIDVPHYKASWWKWVFDAETLIQDSYRRVSAPSRSTPSAHLDTVRSDRHIVSKSRCLSDQGDGRCPGYPSTKVCCRDQVATGRDAQRHKGDRRGE
jgi:hypothetical protein